MGYLTRALTSAHQIIRNEFIQRNDYEKCAVNAFHNNHNKQSDLKSKGNTFTTRWQITPTTQINRPFFTLLFSTDRICAWLNSLFLCKLQFRSGV